jgi:MATE family multidrug resistance protein
MTPIDPVKETPAEAVGGFASPSFAASGTHVRARNQARVLSWFGDPVLVKRVLILAWPVVLEQTLFAVVGLTDTYVVGHLSAAALAAVGLSNQTINLMAAVFGAVATGSLAVVARQIGARERAEASRTTQQSILTAGLIGAVLTIVALILAPQLMLLLGAEAAVAVVGAEYLRISALTFTLLPVLFVGNAILRGSGDTRTPMKIMIVVVLLNAGLALYLTRGAPNMGSNGPAAASMIARGLGGLLVLRALWRGRGGVRLPHEWPRFHWPVIKRVLKIGLPAGLEQLLLQGALVAMTMTITSLGTAAYAAHQVGLNLMSMSYLPGWGFAVAATTLVGQFLGAQEPEKSKASGYISYKLAFVIMLIGGVLLFIFAEPLMRAFVPGDAVVIAYGIDLIHISAFIQPIMAASFVFSGSLRGAGDTRTTLFITVGAIWITRVPLAYLLTRAFDLNGAWLAIGSDFGVRACLFWLRFRSGKWQKIKV